MIYVGVNDSEKELSSYTGRVLREHFGKGPGSVYATITPPYITVYMKNFLSPIENKLLDTEQSKHVQKLRDMLMPTIEKEMKTYLKLQLDMDVQEFYYDWNLDSQSGMFVGITDAKPSEDTCSYPGLEETHNEIIKVSAEAEKPPGDIKSCMLNQRTLLVTRNKILVAVEKELIQLGFSEDLVIAKRNLEKRLLHNHKDSLQTFLHATIENAFVSWDFPKDKSVIVFIIKPDNARQQ